MGLHLCYPTPGNYQSIAGNLIRVLDTFLTLINKDLVMNDSERRRGPLSASNTMLAALVRAS